MNRALVLQRFVLPAAVAALAWMGGYYSRTAAMRSALMNEQKQWTERDRQLREQLLASQKELDELRQQLDLEEEEPHPAEAPASKLAKPPVDDSINRRQLIDMLDAKTRDLEASETAAKELQSRLQEMQTRLGELQEQQTRLQSAEAELRQRTETAAKQVADLQTEAKLRETRLASLEAANQVLRKRGDDSAQRAAKLKKLADDVDDLAHRREAHLTTILGRYREATDLFRAMSIRMDNQRSEPSGSSNDLSRIQNAVSLAEDDLRQLRTLNTRATALQKELQAAAR